MNTVKKREIESQSQFELTTDLLRNLYKFNLTPVTKLVLLELTTHLNENKNGSVVFPSIGYIAEVLGIGLTAAKKAINDLIREGVIIKSKRDKVRGNYNKYIFTQKVQNLTDKQPQNELFKKPDSVLFMVRTNKKEQIEKQTVVKNFPVKNTSKDLLGGNVYIGDDSILADYAAKHGAKNIPAYINTLKKTKSADKIIKDYKQKSLRSLNAYKQTDLLREKRELEKQNRELPETCTAWVELGKKYGIQK